jgi:hypothetical protein
LATTLLLAAASIFGEPRLVLDAGDLRPWRIVHARVESDSPIDAPVFIIGSTWEGGSRLLFERNSAPGLPSFEAAFWIDDGIRAVSLAIGKDGAPAGGEIAVTDGEPAEAPPPQPPFHSPRDGRPSPTFSPRASDLEAAGRAASERLFVSEPPIMSAIFLSLLCVASLAIGSSKRKGKGKASSGKAVAIRFAAAAAASALLGAAALAALPPNRELDLVAFPRGASFSGSYQLVTMNREGWTTRTWGEGPNRLFFARVAPGRDLPLDLVDREGALIRFSEPPIVVGSDEGLALSSREALSGWSLDE